VPEETSQQHKHRFMVPPRIIHYSWR